MLTISHGTTQNGIVRMKKHGVIHGFTVRTRPDQEGNRAPAVMCIAIEGESSAQVVQALKAFAVVEKIHTTNGRRDLIAGLNIDTLARFSDALYQIRMIEAIASTETSILLATIRT